LQGVIYRESSKGTTEGSTHHLLQEQDLQGIQRDLQGIFYRDYGRFYTASSTGLQSHLQGIFYRGKGAIHIFYRDCGGIYR